MRKYIFIFCTLFVFLSNISFSKLIVNPTYLGWATNCTYIIGIIFLLPNTYKKANKQEWLYIFTMILGLVLHSLLPDNKKYTIVDAVQWIFPIVILIASRKYNLPRHLFYTLLGFFIINCILAMVEYRLQKNLFDYYYVESFINFSEKNEFRAFALMEHPLYSANITVLIMLFILIDNNISWKFKSILLTLGTFALLCFNSRTAVIIWACLLIYRTLLYNLKPIYIIVLGILLYGLFLNDFISFIQQNSTIFGRLAEKNSLQDESSLTRLLSYVIFWNSRWNFEDIVFGGRVLFLPGTESSLENGFLLTISWWGWIVGTLKVLLELTISYLCLYKYSFKEKVMLMIACWGIAFSNNNSVNTFVLTFFIITFLFFSSLEKRQILNYASIRKG